MTGDDAFARNRRAGRIGPNAVTRLAEALCERVGAQRTGQIFAAAGHAGYLSEPPGEMIEEQAVTVLHAELRRALGRPDAALVAARAGRLTADYLLAHRIPAPAQWLLRALPAPVAARLLVRAMAGHAWTFAGSGTFAVQYATRDGDPPVRLSIAGCPVCRGAALDAPGCDYYAATFEHLFRTLVKPTSTVQESACAAQGATACGFDVRW